MTLRARGWKTPAHDPWICLLRDDPPVDIRADGLLCPDILDHHLGDARLERILPFLASMHADRATGGPMPTISVFAGAPPLYVHAACHGTAIVLITLAIVSDQIWFMRAGCIVGLAGAIAFSWFAVDVIRRIIVPAR